MYRSNSLKGISEDSRGSSRGLRSAVRGLRGFEGCFRKSLLQLRGFQGVPGNLRESHGHIEGSQERSIGSQERSIVSQVRCRGSQGYFQGSQRASGRFRGSPVDPDSLKGAIRDLRGVLEGIPLEHP